MQLEWVWMWIPPPRKKPWFSAKAKIATVKLKNWRIQQIEYHGCWVINYLILEIKSWIEIVKSTFKWMRTLLCDEVWKLKHRQQRIMKCYVWSKLPCGVVEFGHWKGLLLKDWWLWNYGFTEDCSKFSGLYTSLLNKYTVRPNCKRQLITIVKYRKHSYWDVCYVEK